MAFYLNPFSDRADGVLTLRSPIVFLPPSTSPITFRCPLKPLPHPLRELLFPKFPHVQEPLLAQLDSLPTKRILRRSLADPARDDDGIRLEHDAVVDDLVDRERDEVVVFDDGALVDGVSGKELGSIVRKGWNGTKDGLLGFWRWGGRKFGEGTNFSRMLNASRRHSTTLNSNISFSPSPPTTYIIASPSILNTTTRPSYNITSDVCLFVLSCSPFSNAFCAATVGYGCWPG